MNLEEIVSWAKRRGVVFPSSEIYGGISGVYDLGPKGVALKNNLKNLWWQRFVISREDIVGLESAILMNRRVWQASGHEAGFVDNLIECKKCHHRFRAEDFEIGVTKIKDEVKKGVGGGGGGAKNLPGKFKCTNCGSAEWVDARQFNLMFKTFIGATEDSASQTYLRPETAQGMFVNFKQILETSRQKIPFGIAQIGKSFRNEITPRNFLYRMREFEIAEIEYFVKPDEAEEAFEHWLKEWQAFFWEIGLKKENLKLYEPPKKDLAHYSRRTVDILYHFPFGWYELAGVANRGDFDLRNHQKASGKDLQYYDSQADKKYLPYVIEPTLGIERLILALICDGLEEVPGGRTKTTASVKEKEIVFRILPKLAPIQIAVFPLVKKLSSETKKIYQQLKKQFVVVYDEEGSIGRRYRRQDEIGTPFCLTFDFDSLKDKAVTIRDRDTMTQQRVKIDQIASVLKTKLC